MVSRTPEHQKSGAMKGKMFWYVDILIYKKKNKGFIFGRKSLLFESSILKYYSYSEILHPQYLYFLNKKSISNLNLGHTPMAESSISSVTEKAGFQNSSFLLLKTAQNFSVLQFSSINSRGKYSFLWVALNFTLKDTPKMQIFKVGI